jgi:hypothetical protein
MKDLCDSFSWTTKVGVSFLNSLLFHASVSFLGCTLIAIFGAPKSTPNDAILAVSSALAIKNQLKAIKLKTYMGVTYALMRELS